MRQLPDTISNLDRAVHVHLPADFTAFCLLHGHHYLHYARVRLKDPGISKAVVERALGDIATAWPRALGSPAPAAFGWRSLSARVAGALVRTPATTDHAQDSMHRLLRAAEADAVICHRLMDLSVRDTASLLGVGAETVNQRLSAAADNLGTELAHLFGLRAAP